MIDLIWMMSALNMDRDAFNMDDAIASYRDGDNLNCSQTMVIMMIERVPSSTHDDDALYTDNDDNSGRGLY